MNKPVFQVFKRFMHDRKLTEMISSKSTSSSLIGTQSPRKNNYEPSKQKPLLYGHFINLNEVIKARRYIKTKNQNLYKK